MLKLEYAQMLAELVGTYGGELTLTEEQIREMLSKMPEDLSAERRAVVETAYSLLGKVHYFWGGKSSAIGWDSRWGAPTKVTAPGSRTTGTIRPYGLDCSGFVDWVFNNALGYVIGHGGGAHAQHTHCTLSRGAKRFPEIWRSIPVIAILEYLSEWMRAAIPLLSTAPTVRTMWCYRITGVYIYWKTATLWLQAELS